MNGDPHNPDWEPYSRKTYRVAMLLDVHAEDEKQAFRRINAIVRQLADREPLALEQIGFRMREAREPIMGAVVFIDQLREVVGPAPTAPLPSIAELLDAATPPIYRRPEQVPGQHRLDDPGSANG